MNLRQRALEVLCIPHPDEKVQATHSLWAQRHALNITPQQAPTPSPQAVVPGRPQRPVLVTHTDVPRRGVHTAQGRAALLHSIAHIEFNAINLALDVIWRFNDMPPQFYTDWLRVAQEEAYHFGLLQAQMRKIPCPEKDFWSYGDFPAHDGLWSMCERTAHDVLARMALVPRTLEARGLDATPTIQAKLQQTGLPDALEAVDILNIILRDEIGHVAIGNHWYAWLCARQNLDPQTHYPVLVERYCAPRLKPPFNRSARMQAGFTEAELAWLEQDHG